MTRKSPRSENLDGGVTIRKSKHRAKRAAAETMVRVERIGRNTKRLYCEQCGQKRRACQCEEPS